MNSYQTFNIALISELPLPELPKLDPGTRSELKIFFRLASGPLPSLVSPEWFDRWYRDAEESCLFLAVAGEQGRYLLHFPALADFVVDLDRNQIECHRVSDVPDETVRHLLLDQVMPRVLGQFGNLVLHASAVSPAEGGMAFLGNSGWGKSTLASSFHNQGASLIADDSLLLDTLDNQIIGYPAYSGSKLWQDSADSIFPDGADLTDVAHYSEKKRIILHSARSTLDPIRLDAIFFLNDPEAGTHPQSISIEPIGGAEIMMKLIKSAFLLDVRDMRAVERQFACASRIAAVNPVVYKLNYPRDFAVLSQVKAEIRSMVRQTLGRKEALLPA